MQLGALFIHLQHVDFPQGTLGDAFLKRGRWAKEVWKHSGLVHIPRGNELDEDSF